MLTKTKIINKTIELGDIPYYIADLAANHDGDIQRAKDLIWRAKEAGADCAKFQHFLPDKIVNDYEFSRLQDTKTHQASWKKSVSEIYDQYHFRRDWDSEIIEECKKAEIDFSTTPYDAEAVNAVKDKLDFLKIGSGDISWLDHISLCAETNLPIIVATGASNLDDVSRVVNLLKEKKVQYSIMQCNTNYTLESDKHSYTNIRVLDTYKKLFPQAILGLSDHTLDEISVLASLPYGVKLIEKHFTDDNSREGPDHKFAINPKNWKIMVDKSCKLIECLGDGIKKIEDNEKDAFVVQRRSCVAAIDIDKNQTINADMVTFLRPCPDNSFHPYEIKELIGKSAKQSIPKGSSIRRKWVS